MNIDRHMAALLAAPLIGLCLPALLFFRKLPETPLTPAERELIGFSSQAVTVALPASSAVYEGLVCPIRPPAAKTAGEKGAIPVFAGGPLQKPSAPPASRKTEPAKKMPEITMIYGDGRVRTAIIDGEILREGSALGSGKVMAIQTTRVLLRTSGRDTWLNIK